MPWHNHEIPATTLTFKRDYPNFPEFKKLDLKRINRELILSLQNLRSFSGIPIIPSPLQAGWTRTDSKSKNSRHYVIGRLSDAGDVFPARGRALELWVTAQQLSIFGGIGIYADTKGPDGEPWPMLHLDLRGHRVLWARDKGRYYNFPRQGPGFWSVIQKVADMEF